MFCVFCGQKIDFEEMLFCTSCGKEVFKGNSIGVSSADQQQPGKTQQGVEAGYNPQPPQAAFNAAWVATFFQAVGSKIVETAKKVSHTVRNTLLKTAPQVGKIRSKIVEITKKVSHTVRNTLVKTAPQVGKIRSKIVEITKKVLEGVRNIPLKTTVKIPLIALAGLVVVGLFVGIFNLLNFSGREESGSFSTYANINNPKIIKATTVGKFTYFIYSSQEIYKFENGSKGYAEKVSTESLTIITPIIIGDTCYYLGAGEDDTARFRLYTFALTTGEIKEYADILGSEMTYDGKYLYIMTDMDEIIKIDPNSLKILEIYRLNEEYFFPHVFMAINGKVYYKQNYLYTELEMETGKETILGDYHISNLCGDDNAIYYLNNENQKICAIPHGSNQPKVIFDSKQIVEDDKVFNMTVDGDYVYFSFYNNLNNEDLKYSLYRVKTDGTGLQGIKTPYENNMIVDGVKTNLATNIHAFTVKDGWVSVGEYSFHIEKDKITEWITFINTARRSKLNIPLENIK